METIDMRSLSRDARHVRRVQVIRLRAAGYAYEAIAAQTSLSHANDLARSLKLGPGWVAEVLRLTMLPRTSLSPSSKGGSPGI